MTSTLMDYVLPSAEHSPALVTDTNETPSPLNPLGAPGECVKQAASRVEAVLDALAELRITTTDMPLTPE